MAITSLVISLCIFMSCTGGRKYFPSVIPMPVHMKQSKGHLELNNKTRILVDGQDTTLFDVAEYLSGRVKEITGFPLEVVKYTNQKSDGEIIFRTSTSDSLPDNPEGYRLGVNKTCILLEGRNPQGIFLGTQTLFQILSDQIVLPRMEGQPLLVPSISVVDYPRYPYRGMHLDVSRHFFPVSFIKKYIDLLAAFKYNTFHWHLTDDQGWRIEVKKYPKMTQIGAFRKAQDSSQYGGFYSQDEIREIVAYAGKRFITVIPEIEMPAHSQAALAAYPEYSCKGKPLDVPTDWGVFESVYCAGNDSTFTFIENILTEVIELFPSKYIHIGGDECGKTEWKQCAKCQARMKAENLTDELQLQSYFIKRIERFLLSQGRQLVGWDEILEGGLAESAVVMSWRGMSGGIEAAKAGHDVIMTPTDFCYFNNHQADPEFEPTVAGGYITLKKVYSFEPTPPELNTTEASHVLGAQANVWTENIATPDHAEYMVVPRMLALSEVLWSPVKVRNWLSFRKRLSAHFPRFRDAGINYCPGDFRVEIKSAPNQKAGTMGFILKSEQPDFPIYYSLDGSEPSRHSKLFEKPFTLSKSAIVAAALIGENGLPIRSANRINFDRHLAVGAPITFNVPCSPKYNPGGEQGVNDGIRGSIKFNDGYWRGHEGKDFIATIDLGKQKEINSIVLSCLHHTGVWIFMPDTVTFEMSTDGNAYSTLGKLHHDYDKADNNPKIEEYLCDAGKTQARFLRVTARNVGTCPSWHPGAGGLAWVFVDEIIVR